MKLNRQNQDWKKIFTTQAWEKELCVHNLLKRTPTILFSHKGQTNQQKLIKHLNRQFTQETIQMTNKYTKKLSTTLIIRKLQTKI